MAKIKQGILGGFSGKVAGVVGTSWKGRAVMKSRPLSVSNPRTDAQVEQRGKFSDIAKLASSILTTFVQPVENPISGDVSGYNKFVKDNKAAFNTSGKLVAANFVAGGGKLPFMENTTYETREGETAFYVSWVNPVGMSALRGTDKVYGAVFDLDGNLLGVSSGATTRSDGNLSVDLTNQEWSMTQGAKFVYLVAFVSADGRDVSVLAPAKEDEVLSEE